jgi:FXSXX-COOH protein
METSAADVEFDVVNLRGATPADLDALPGNALGESLRRVLRDTVDDPLTHVATFNSAL